MKNFKLINTLEVVERKNTVRYFNMKLVRAQANNNSKSNKKPDDNDLAFRGVVVEGRKQPLHHKPSLDEEKKMVSYFLGRDKALKKGRPMTI